MRFVRLLTLSSLFGVFFYLGYYFWWPFVFLVTAPLGLLAGRPIRVWETIGVVVVTSLTWLAVYHYFNTFSEFGLAVLALYHGVIVALVVLSASWWRRRFGFSMCFIMPVIWVGGEFWRMSGSLGMPFGLLAQPAYEQLWMIQVSDLGGSYVLSFAMAMIGGLIADLISEKKSSKTIVWSKVKRVVIATATVWIFVAVYGVFRIHQSKETMTTGPTLALVQIDYPTHSDGSLGPGSDPNVLLQQLLAFSSESLESPEKPDLIIWPESPAGIPPLNREWLEAVPTENSISEHQLGRRFQSLILSWVDRERVSILLGSRSRQGTITKNSALRFDPGVGQSDAIQDKLHLFPLGEYLPWEGTIAHRWLQKNVANGRVDWIVPGDQREIFSLHDEPSRYAVAICNEAIYPRDIGTFLSANDENQKPVDFVINIADNGGFLRNRAMIHNHFLLPFRAVEGRLGIARSANTGISAFFKPTGEVYGEVTNSMGQMWTGKGAPELALIAEVIELRANREKELAINPKLRDEFEAKITEIRKLRAEAGVSGQSVRPIYLDSRRTLYSRTGDLFGKILFGFLTLGIIGFLGDRLSLVAGFFNSQVREPIPHTDDPALENPDPR